MGQPGHSISIAMISLLLCGPALSQSSLPYMNYAPVWSPDGSKVAFYSTRDGDWEIYSVNSDGSELARLTDSPGYDGEPTWSGDGTKIAFVSDRDGDSEIFIMNADGSDVVQVTHNDYADDVPSWSPTANEILYRSAPADLRYIYLISSDGTRNRQLSGIAAEGRLAWSRDGSEIVFVVDHGRRQALYRMSRDGNEIGLIVTEHQFPGNPSYSPEHDALLYDAHIDGIAESGDGKWELWSITLDGATMNRLTTNDADDWGGQWSPDGKYLVFAGGGLDNNGYEIFTLDVHGGGLRQVTNRQN